MAATPHRPRERLIAAGPAALTDAELLALVIQSGSAGHRALDMSRALLCRFGSVVGLRRCRVGELIRAPGFGVARACAVMAASELGVRAESSPLPRGSPLLSAADVYRYLRPRLAHLAHEVFVTLALDNRRRVVTIDTVAQGDASGVEVHPREVFQPAVREGATAVVVAHNHPSGDAEPSADDLALTERLRQAGQILGIPLLDHVIVAATGFSSLAGRSSL